MTRLVVGAAGAVPAAALAIAAQACWTATRKRPDLEPAYAVDAFVAPPGTRGDHPVELVVVGDSLAAGVGAPTVDESLPALVARRVADRLGRPVHVVGHGVSGERTAGVTRTQLPLVGEGVDVTVVVVGSNDVTGLTSPSSLRRQTAELLATVQARTGAVVLAGIPLFGGPLLRPPLLWAVAAYARALRAIQRAVAEGAGASYVDIAGEASPRFARRPEAMSSDGYHPSPVGYGFWADALAPAVVTAYSASR